MLPAHLDAAIETGSWQIPALFQFLIEKSQMPLADARRSFNLGVGMVVIANKANAGEVLLALRNAGEAAWVLGELVPGKGEVRYR